MTKAWYRADHRRLGRGFNFRLKLKQIFSFHFPSYSSEIIGLICPTMCTSAAVKGFLLISLINYITTSIVIVILYNNM
jgi:hypothetical protein